MTACFGQNVPKLHNEEIESSKRYQKGNIYQKDLLLYLDMLGETHPYYADESNRAKLEKQAKKMYRECAKLTTDEIYYFKRYLQRFASSLHDGHTTIYYWGDCVSLSLNHKITGGGGV
jgi:hypothetical protein